MELILLFRTDLAMGDSLSQMSNSRRPENTLFAPLTMSTVSTNYIVKSRSAASEKVQKRWCGWAFIIVHLMAACLSVHRARNLKPLKLPIVKKVVIWRRKEKKG